MRQIDTPEFKNWFGDSKVVDPEGSPLRVFHGTSKDFSVFRCPAMFHVEPQYSSQVSGDGPGANVKACYLRLENPADLRALHISPSDPGFAEKVPGLRFQGYDGAQYRRQVWIAFEPSQIKSATGNRGSFNPRSQDIGENLSRKILTLTKNFKDTVVDQ